MTQDKLIKRVAAFPPRAPGAVPSGQLFELLRGFALSERRDEAQIFPPIREAARHFGVPVSRAARLYHRLEKEGILRSVRGSRTLLQGLSSTRTLKVRALIGLPAYLPWFVTRQDYRTFFIRTRRELHARGFAVATVFYDGAEAQQHGRLRARIEKHEFDIVVWHQPDRAAREVAGHLKDSGVRVLGVSDLGFPSFRCRYEVQREEAIASILQAWRRERTIGGVVVVRGRETSAAGEESLRRLLDEAGLEHQFLTAPEKRGGDFVDSLAIGSGQGVVLPASAAAMCAYRAPDALGRLMARARVALTGGPVSIAFAPVPEVTADLVGVDWQLAAEQIAGDLINNQAFDAEETTLFKARPHLRASLPHYAQSL